MQQNLNEFFQDISCLNPKDENNLAKTISILQTSSYKREDEELGHLFQVLKNNALFKDFFVEMPIETSFNLLRSFRYLYHDRGDEVFRIGDTAKNFYLILKGSVQVITPSKFDSGGKTDRSTGRLDTKELNDLIVSKKPLPTRKKEKMVEQPVGFRENLISERVFSKKNTVQLDALPADHFATFNNNSNEPMSTERLLTLYPDFHILNTLRDGDYFGDIALSLRTFRTATVICREPCHFLILNSSAYYRVLNEYQEERQKELFTFLRSLSLIKSWPSENVIGIMRHLKELKVKRNVVLYDYKDPVDNFYIIRQGEVEITKEADLQIGNEEVYRRTTANSRSPMQTKKSDLLNVNAIWNSQYKQVKKQHVRMALLGPHQSFGEEEVVLDIRERKTKAIVISQNADILTIPLDKLIENAKNPAEFLNIICGKNPKNRWRNDFETQAVKINTQNDPRSKPAKKEMLKNKKVFIPLESMSGFLKLDERATKTHSNFKSTSISNQQNPFVSIEELDKDSSFMRNPSPGLLRNNSNASQKGRKLIVSPQKQPNINVASTPQLYQAYDNADKSLQYNKLWELNISHYQNRRWRNPNKKKYEKSPSQSKRTLGSSFDLTSAKSIPTLRDAKPHNDKNRSPIYIASDTRVHTTPTAHQFSNGATPMLPDSAHMIMLSPLLGSEMDSVEEYKRKRGQISCDTNLDRKLGIQKLFPETELLSRSPHLSINFRNYVESNTSTPKMKTSTRDNGKTSSFSSVVQKVNNQVNLKNLSPGVIRKIKSHLDYGILPPSNQMTNPSSKEGSPVDMKRSLSPNSDLISGAKRFLTTGSGYRVPKVVTKAH